MSLLINQKPSSSVLLSRLYPVPSVSRTLLNLALQYGERTLGLQKRLCYGISEGYYSRTYQRLWIYQNVLDSASYDLFP
jgi:hypothetical protein